MTELIRRSASAVRLHPVSGRSVVGWVESHPVGVLLCILLVVALLGLAQLWLYPPSFEFNWENRWWQIAVSVARGEGYVACKQIYFPFCGPSNQVTAMREPLPVLLFSLIAILTNESLLVAAASGIVVNTGIVLAVFLLARELAGTRAGLLGALLWACYLAPVRLFYSQPSGDLLATLALTCGMLHFLRGRRTDRQSEWLMAGIWIGAAMLSRSAALVVALALTAGALLASWKSAPSTTPGRPTAIRRHGVALFALAWSLTASPWYIRNYAAFDRPVLGSTLSGYYLYRQNHHLSSDDYLRFVTGGEFVPVLQEMITRRRDLLGTENEAAMDLVYRQEALPIIAAEPLRYMTLSAYRLLMLWFNWGVRAAYQQRNTVGDHLTVLQHIVFLVGAAVGLRGRRRWAWPLVAAVAAYSLAYAAAMAHLPYVVAIMPMLVALTAAAFGSASGDRAPPVPDHLRAAP